MVAEKNEISVSFPNSIVDPKNGIVFVGTVFLSDGDEFSPKFDGEIEIKNRSAGVLQLTGVLAPKFDEFDPKADLPLTLESGKQLGNRQEVSPFAILLFAFYCV